jgi:hypothetical protein
LAISDRAMKKIIKTVVCLVFICIHLAFEFYPTGKTLAKKYIRTIDFKNALKAKPLAKYISFLAEEEKNNLAIILEDLYQPKTKK